MGKRYDWQVTPQNTPRFKERKLLFLLAMGMFLLNLILTAFFFSEDMKWSLFGAFCFGLFAGVQCFDKRAVLWTWGYVIFWIAFSFVASAVLFVWHKAYWWFIGYGIEFIVFALAARLIFKRKTSRISDHRKLFICPVWQCDRLDSYLSGTEKDGYRLVGTSWLGLMYFQKSAPKSVRYFCTYTCLKDRSMKGIEDQLRSKYRANPVPTGNGTRHIHRIIDGQADLTELEELRRRSILRVILARVFFAAAVWVGIICASALLQFNVLILAALCILAATVLYYAIGLMTIIWHHASKY